MRDTENVGFTVGGDWASAGLARSLALEYRGGSLRLSVGSGVPGGRPPGPAARRRNGSSPRSAAPSA